MAKRKNKKADKPQYVGTVTFDGNIQVNLHGEVKTLRTDIGGLALQKANPNKELLVLTRDHVGYNEIDTGYIVRSKRYDNSEMPFFGLKHEPDADGWACHNYCDVIAWGYADGGLNDPTLFYSCQSTIEEEIEREKYRAEHGMKTHAEKLAELEAELDEEMDDDFPSIERKGIVLRYDSEGDGAIHYNAVVSAEEDMERGGTPLMHACAKMFTDFRKEHPEVTEMHFYTDDEVSVEE